MTHILTGTPPADNTGSAVIPVTVNDGKGGTFIGTVTIIPVNPAPIAVDDTQATQALTATPLTLVANDSDPDGDPYTVTAATLADPTQGTLTLVGSNWVFTSAAGVTGPVVVNYTITDQDGATASAKHTVEVNGPPTLTDPDPTPGTPSVDPLNPNNLVIPAVDAVAFGPVDLDDYITDPNTGDTLTYTVNPADVPTWAAFDPVTHILTGTPPADNTGSVIIPVTVNDGKGGTFIGSVTIVPVNPAPDAVDDTQAVAPGTATVLTLQANDPADDDAPLTVTATLADPTKGTLTQLPNGDWQFTSAPGVSGDVVVNYTVTDQDGASDSAIHTITVANQPPVLGDPDPTPGTPSIDPLNPNNLVIPAVDAVAFAPVDLDDYIKDPNTGDTLTYTVNPADVPTWAAFDPVTHILTGTPPADNTGSVIIPVTVNDGKGGTFIGSVTIVPVNPAPDAVDDTQAVAPGTATVLDTAGQRPGRR